MEQDLIIYVREHAKEYKENPTRDFGQNKDAEYRQHICAITDGLVRMAEVAGRTKFTCNQLLRECYNLVDHELHTYDEWKELGAVIRKGQHPYLFWGDAISLDCTKYTFYPVRFLYCEDQVIRNSK